MEITAKEQDLKNKNWKKLKTDPENSATTLNTLTFKILGPRRRREKKWSEKIFEEIIVKNFPNMGKEIATQVWEVQRDPCRINPRRNTPRHILIKLTKIKHRERILKVASEKQQVTYKGNLIRLTADLSAETLQAKRECRIYLKYWKGKIYNQDYCTQQGSHSKLIEE